MALSTRSIEKHVSVPRVIPNTDHFVLFVNDLEVDGVPNNINAPRSLVMSSLTEAKPGHVLADVNSLSGGNIYPNRIHPWPHRMFLKVHNSKLIM